MHSVVELLETIILFKWMFNFAKLFGLDDLISHGIFSTGFLTMMLTNCLQRSSLRSWENILTAMIHIGDSVTCTGKIIEKFEESREKLVRLKLQTNSPQAQTIFAESVVALD